MKWLIEKFLFLYLSIVKDKFNVSVLHLLFFNYVIIYVDDKKIFKMRAFNLTDLLSKMFPVSLKNRKNPGKNEEMTENQAK